MSDTYEDELKRRTCPECGAYQLRGTQVVSGGVTVEARTCLRGHKWTWLKKNKDSEWERV